MVKINGLRWEGMTKIIKEPLEKKHRFTIYSVLYITSRFTNFNHYYIQYISNYLRQGGRIIMNISLHMKKKQQQQ